MAAHRQDRLNRQIAAKVGEILRTVKDPRVSGALICVTGAEVSPDLSNAKIFYGFLGSSGTTQEIAKGLASASGYIRSELAARLNTRITPKLTFIHDNSAENAMNISRILKEIETDEGTER